MTGSTTIMQKKIFKSLKVVNDTAERGVQLMAEYNSILTRNELERQHILEVVSEYRKTYPTSKKKDLVTPLNK